MKKIYLSLLALCSILWLASCDPTPGNSGEEGNTPSDTTIVNPLSAFIGDYDLHIDVSGYYVDDVASDSQSENFNGDLKIEFPEGLEHPNYVVASGTFDFGGEQRLIYSTTGTLDADGNLQLEDNTYQASVPITISYSAIKQQEPLTFHTTMSCSISGYDVRYELDNTATRRNR